jgi:hypothetical protein
MVVARPIARPLLVSLLLGGLAVFAALSVSHGLAPYLSAVSHAHTSVVYAPATSGHAPVQAAPAPPPVSGSEAAQEAAPPQGPGRPAANGIQRFADDGPGISGRAAPQPAQSCSPKLCPRPQR